LGPLTSQGVYLDTSVLVALMATDRLTARAELFLADDPSLIFISDFAGAEFASAIARRFRAREITQADGMDIFAGFDAWRQQIPKIVSAISIDIACAEAFVRRLDITLRAPDALHIAICQRVGLSLVTFDDKMAASARMLGVDVAAA